MITEREWCKECGGMGHGKDCQCKSGAEFICGCCKTCGGEGMITLPLKRPLILPPDIDKGWRRPAPSQPVKGDEGEAK